MNSPFVTGTCDGCKTSLVRLTVYQVERENEKRTIKLCRNCRAFDRVFETIRTVLGEGWRLALVVALAVLWTGCGAGLELADEPAATATGPRVLVFGSVGAAPELCDAGELDAGELDAGPPWQPPPPAAKPGGKMPPPEPDAGEGDGGP